MGQKSNNLINENSLSTILSHYRPYNTYEYSMTSNSKIIIYQSKYNNQQMLCVKKLQLTQQLNNSLKYYKYRQDIHNDHIIILHKMQVFNKKGQIISRQKWENLNMNTFCIDNNMCQLNIFQNHSGSNIRHQTYIVELVYQYFGNNLQKQIKKRESNNQNFKQEQIWSIICSSSIAAYQLINKNYKQPMLSPKTIFLSQKGIIKLGQWQLVDYMIINNNNAIFIEEGETCFEQINSRGELQVIDSCSLEVYHQILRKYYWAPQSLYIINRIIESGRFYKEKQYYKHFKSQIFSLGMTIIHMCLLKPLYQLETFSQKYIEKLLMQVKSNCLLSSDLLQLLQAMLKWDCNERISYDELYEIISQKYAEHKQPQEWLQTQIQSMNLTGGKNGDMNGSGLINQGSGDHAHPSEEQESQKYREKIELMNSSHLKSFLQQSLNEFKNKGNTINQQSNKLKINHRNSKQDRNSNKQYKIDKQFHKNSNIKSFADEYKSNQLTPQYTLVSNNKKIEQNIQNSTSKYYLNNISSNNLSHTYPAQVLLNDFQDLQSYEDLQWKINFHLEQVQKTDEYINDDVSDRLFNNISNNLQFKEQNNDFNPLISDKCLMKKDLQEDQSHQYSNYHHQKQKIISNNQSIKSFNRTSNQFNHSKSFINYETQENIYTNEEFLSTAAKDCKFSHKYEKPILEKQIQNNTNKNQKNNYNRNSNNDESNKNNIKNINNGNNTNHSNVNFVKQNFSKGYYQGSIINGKKNGYGVFYYNQGGKYCGFWANNQMHGQGTLYYPDGRIAYKGQWFNDFLHGQGILYNEKPLQILNQYNYQSFNQCQTNQCWISYEGSFQEDDKHGHGILVLSNGQKYEGEFKNDNVHGKGVFYCKNNKQILAIWKNNELEKIISQF